MALESSFNFIDDLDSSNPTSGDDPSEGDDHIRGVKNAVKGSFTSLGSEAVTATAAELNTMGGITASTAEINQLDGATVTAAQLNNIAQQSEETTLSASGATLSFTAAPSWAKEVIISFSKVSASADAVIQLQLGVSGGLDSTADYNTTYHGTELAVITGATSASVAFFRLGTTGNATQNISGRVVLSKQEGANEWCLSGDLGGTASIYFFSLSGSKTLSGALTQLQLSLSTGNYDAGNVGVRYQG